MLGQLVPDGVDKMEHLTRVLFPPIGPAVFSDVVYTFRSFDVFGSHAVSIQGRRLVTGSNRTHVHLAVKVGLIQELSVVEEDNLPVELDHLLQPVDVVLSRYRPVVREPNELWSHQQSSYAKCGRIGRRVIFCGLCHHGVIEVLELMHDPLYRVSFEVVQSTQQQNVHGFFFVSILQPPHVFQVLNFSSWRR